MKKNQVDINCDMGESFGNYKIGNDERILPYITSCNVACGFHGGDPVQIEKTIKKALAHKVQIGAHPSFPDLQGFGRRNMQIPPDELRAIVKYQVAAVKGITESLGGQLAYVKPHGALYNTAARDRGVAESIIAAIRELNSDIAIMGLAGSLVNEVTTKSGLRFIGEAFADRRYTSQGQLQSRSQKGAVIYEAAEAAKQVLSIVLSQEVKSYEDTSVSIQAQSICIHGDNPQAEQILQAIDVALRACGVEKRAF